MLDRYPDILTPSQVAEALSLTPQQVNSLCRRGLLPCVQISQRRRVIAKAHLLAWMEKGGNNAQ